MEARHIGLAGLAGLVVVVVRPKECHMSAVLMHWLRDVVDVTNVSAVATLRLLLLVGLTLVRRGAIWLWRLAVWRWLAWIWASAALWSRWRRRRSLVTLTRCGRAVAWLTVALLLRWVTLHRLLLLISAAWLEGCWNG